MCPFPLPDKAILFFKANRAPLSVFRLTLYSFANLRSGGRRLDLNSPSLIPIIKFSIIWLGREGYLTTFLMAFCFIGLLDFLYVLIILQKKKMLSTYRSLHSHFFLKAASAKEKLTLMVGEMLLSFLGKSSKGGRNFVF